MAFFSILVRAFFGALILRPLLWVQCRRLKIEKPKMTLGRGLKKHTLGKAKQDDYSIFIDLMKPISGWVLTVIHESRHCWQYQKHEDIVKWCHARLSPYAEKRKEFYYLNPLELDAYYYEQHFGRISNNFIDKLSVNDLERWYQDDTYFDKMMDIVHQYRIQACEAFLSGLL